VTEIREATAGDVAAMFHVRVSVAQNAMNVDQLRARGITPQSVAAALQSHCKAWVIEQNAKVVAFSIADARAGSIWALFVLPEYEGLGYGRALLTAAAEWLWERGFARIWLTTAPDTRAAAFYLHLGWRPTGVTPHGETRFELSVT